MTKSESQMAMNNKRALKSRLLGPGTIVMIVGVMVVVGWQLLVPPKVRIERKVETSGYDHFGRKPSISDLLSWSPELELSVVQRESLVKLAKEERSKLVPVKTMIAKTLQRFNEFAEQHKSEAAGVNDMQAEIAPIQALSRQKRKIEQDFAERGLAVLTQGQRQKVLQVWQEQRFKARGRGEASS